MKTIDDIIKSDKDEDKNIKKENKNNFENIRNTNHTLEEQILSSINEIENNNNNNSSTNKEINDSLNKNISIYNNIKEKENQKGNEQEEEKNENNIKEKLEEKKGENTNENLPEINDIITDELDNYKDDFYERDRTYSFRPKKRPDANNLNQNEEKIKVNEFKLDNVKNPKSKETNEIKENSEISQNFGETIMTKIESNENYLTSLNDQITVQKNSNDNINNINNNINNNKIKINIFQSFKSEKIEPSNDESEDNTNKDDEDFLASEELKRKKIEENKENNEEKKEKNEIEIIEERKDEEEEEDHNEESKNNNNKNDEEEAQRKYLEEQDKRKSLKNIRKVADERSSALRKSVEQMQKQLLEKIKKNKEKNENNNDNNQIKEETNINKNNNNIKEKNETKENKDTIKKENKNDNNNNKKYVDKINAKKKQLSNTVFNRLYNNDKKKEKEKEKENQANIKKTEKKKLKKNNKLNKTQTSESLYRTNNIFNTITINENSLEENNLLNNSKNTNSHFPMLNDLKKEINNNPSKKHKKRETNPNSLNSNSFIQKFINDSKNLEISKKLEQFKQPIIFDDSEYETYSFKPEINKKSIDLCKKKFKKRKNSSPLNNKTERENTYIESRRTNAPIGELLYKAALNQKQKLDNICIKEIKNIKDDGNKSLISKGSTNLLLKKNELKLREIIDRYASKNNGKLSIINTIQSLWEIHILREFLKNCKNIGEINLEYVKNIAEEVMNKKGKGIREYEEIEFVEQLWIKINPNYENENDFIDKATLFKFFKLLFSLNEQTEINKLILSVDNFLKNINKKEGSTKNEINLNNKENVENDNKEINDINNENNNEPKENNENDNQNKEINTENKENNENDNQNKEINTENKDNNENSENNNKLNDSIKDNNLIKKYKSLLRRKEFEKKEIWPISKFIRVFFELKKLISTYKSSKKDKIMEEIIKEREKELTFEPNFNATSSYFRKKNKKDNNEDLHNTSINSNISSQTNKKKHDFNKLYEEFMMKKQMHEKALMILRENKEKRELKMCTDRPKINRGYIIKNRKKTPEVGCTRNEFLYNLNKDIMNKRKERESEREQVFLNKKIYPFMPNISNNDILMNKSFREGPQNKPKGSENYIKRNRSVIQFKKREKENENNKIIGSNYEKTLNRKVNLPKIKDLEPSTNLVQQKEEENNNINNKNDDAYFTIQIKTAKGRIKPLKIYINNNPIETANTFCDENNIKKSTRDRIIQKIKELQHIYKDIGNQEDKKESDNSK